MKKFKTLLLLSLIISLVFTLNGCKDDVTQNNSLTGTYLIAYKEVMPIPVASSATSLTLTEVSDSRCPINAICTTAGSALVKVKFMDGNAEEVIELCLGECFTVVKTIKSKGVKYSISITELNPYPTTAYIIASRPVAKIVIAKL
jgi:hypothetical protein